MPWAFSASRTRFVVTRTSGASAFYAIFPRFQQKSPSPPTFKPCARWGKTCARWVNRVRDGVIVCEKPNATNWNLYAGRHANETHRPRLLPYHFSSPSPPISRVISSIRSNGNGGDETGFMARDISFMGLSSAAIRLELNAPHTLQR